MAPLIGLDLDASPYHHSIAALGDGRTKILASYETPNACILFVHGFNGDALETWEGFDTVALRDSRLKHADLVFFGYDGVRSNVLASASFLYDLIDDLLTKGTSVADLRNEVVKYQRCVVVAHSLGAVVSRWAILRGYTEHRPWMERVRYLLFAPAHCGEIIVGNLMEVLATTKITKALVGVAHSTVPLLKELGPESRVLRTLEHRTRAAISAGCETLRANRVVVAEYEDVVSNVPFAEDPFPTAVRDAHHTSVCKPTMFRNVVDFVTELLS